MQALERGHVSEGALHLADTAKQIDELIKQHDLDDDELAELAADTLRYVAELAKKLEDVSDKIDAGIDALEHGKVGEGIAHLADAADRISGLISGHNAERGKLAQDVADTLRKVGQLASEIETIADAVDAGIDAFEHGNISESAQHLANAAARIEQLIARYDLEGSEVARHVGDVLRRIGELAGDVTGITDKVDAGVDALEGGKIAEGTQHLADAAKRVEALLNEHEFPGGELAEGVADTLRQISHLASEVGAIAERIESGVDALKRGNVPEGALQLADAVARIEALIRQDDEEGSEGSQIGRRVAETLRKVGEIATEVTAISDKVDAGVDALEEGKIAEGAPSTLPKLPNASRH